YVRPSSRRWRTCFIQRGLEVMRVRTSEPRVCRIAGIQSRLKSLAGNPEALAALQSGEANVVGGTAWLWSRPEFESAVDVLFVDEAGQMALANVIAVSQAANSVVLLGDPQQLEQPQKGSHPDGVNVSALEHILAGSQTISADRGMFLPV